MESPGLDSHGGPSLNRLFLSFLRLGMTAFGGPAMVAYIRKLAVEKNRWLEEASFQEGVALCQTIPGATAMQTAAYVGLRARGVAGAAACFVGFGLPAFGFMAILSAVYAGTHELPPVVAVFAGLRAMTVAIVANATVSFGKRSLRGTGDLLLAGLAAVLFAARVNPVVVIGISALVGLVLYRRRDRTKHQAAASTRIASGAGRRLVLLLGAAVTGLGLLWALDRELFELGSLMFRIDLFAFGGGFASVPLMYHEIVEVRSWMDGETFMNGIALGQVTPGPIVITATFVGYLLHGAAGAAVATICIFLPSFLMVVGLVPYFDRLRSSVLFQRCLWGILASFVGLLLSVTIQFGLDVPWDIPRTALALAALAALVRGVDVMWVVLIGTAASVVML
ncbi:MAG: chromate efflux transporter [Thermoguttaceae bacterium]